MTDYLFYLEQNVIVDAIIIINFRKILPSKSNTPQRLLSDAANDINRRKLLVNSQVTAMITISELAYGVLYSVIYGFVSKGSSFGTLIQGISVHYVIVPYVFLMNTSYNKYRVVEIGWKNVLKNILWKCGKNRVSNLYTISSESNSSSTDNSKRKDSDTERSTDSTKPLIENCDNEPKEKIDDIESHNSFDIEIPTTSKGFESKDKKDIGIPNIIPADSSDDDDDMIVYPQEYKDKASKCKEILLAMSNVLVDEEIYIQYFKKLVDVVEGIEYQKMTANINQNLSLGIKGSTNPNGKCKQPMVDLEQPLNPNNLFWTLEERYLNDSNTCQHSFKGDKAERNAMRNKLLQKLLLYLDQHEKQLNLIRRLIDVEESFII